MIDKKVFIEIKKLLDNSENPLFFFDDDCDGTCAYLILRKHKGYGYSVPVKGNPELNMDFYHKVKEYTPDLVFILDKPKLSQEFVDNINVPIIWIDHHPIQKVNGVKIYFNPLIYDNNDTRSTTFWAYEIIKENMWVAMIGCIADFHIPNFSDEFVKKYPDLFSTKIKDPAQALFETKVGLLVKIISFNLKGKTTYVRKSLNSLVKIKDPYEILDRTSKEGQYLWDRYESINIVYSELLKKALNEKHDENFVIYTYSDNGLAVSSELSNELQYKFPNKYVIVGRVKENAVVLSVRNKTNPVRDILLKAIEGLNASVGGHLHACGGSIPKDNFVLFIKRFKDLALKELKIEY